MATFDDLRAALTRYKADPQTMVLIEDYEAIIGFIEWLESERGTTVASSQETQ